MTHHRTSPHLLWFYKLQYRWDKLLYRWANWRVERAMRKLYRTR